jgi:hypothetical protein
MFETIFELPSKISVAITIPGDYRGLLFLRLAGYAMASLVFCTLPLLAQNPPLAQVTGKHDGKLILVPVRVNNKGPFWFCVDSGASHTVMDPFIVARLKLKQTAAAATTGTGKGKVHVGHVGPVSIQLGSQPLTIEDPWIIDLSGVPIPKWVHGLIGAEFFERFVLELEPNRPLLTLYDQQKYRPAKNAVSLPLLNEDHKFFVQATIEVNTNKIVEHKLRIDTGSSDSVADEVTREGRQVRETVAGRGLGDDFKALSGLLQALNLGPFRWTNVWGPAIPQPLIGMEIFRRFTTTFDVPHRLLYLAPNEHLTEKIPAPAQ